MRLAIPALSLLTVSMLGANVTAYAADARYYDPSNVASPSGNTVGYELYRTIGCPGKQLLDPACKVPPAPTPEPKPAPVAAPVAAAAVVAAVAAAPKDSDGDGVTDDKDKCPTTPAGRKVNAEGCELDSDGDGVVDGLDKCPNTPAGRKVDANGCEMDGDKDGVVDGLDKCPTTPAGDKVDKDGCTLLSTIILKGVNFANDSDVLTGEAMAVLDEAVETLRRYPGMKVEIAGHTDSNDSDEYNMDLSERRAKAVRYYFMSRVIPADTLTAKGYGESQPIADNSTEEGRAANRRVELRIIE